MKIIVMDITCVIIDGIDCGSIADSIIEKPQLAPQIQIALEEWWEGQLNTFKKICDAG